LEFACLQGLRPGANPLRRSLGRGPVDDDVGHQPRNRLAVARDHDFLSFQDAVQQGAQRVLGLECADLSHGFLNSLA